MEIAPCKSRVYIDEKRPKSVLLASAKVSSLEVNVLTMNDGAGNFFLIRLAMRWERLRRLWVR